VDIVIVSGSMLKCKVCGVELIGGYNAAISHLKHGSYLCRVCNNKIQVIYRHTESGRNASKMNARKQRCRMKLETLKHYSPDVKCVRCGFSDIRALSIDHVNGDGAKHRKEVFGNGRIGTGFRFYYWLKNNCYPTGFQVLCMNCQFIKRTENNEVDKS
jgi:hypothetical protein